MLWPYLAIPVGSGLMLLHQVAMAGRFFSKHGPFASTVGVE
jgi:TRAP-type C4-dicarboxylate transport system permease small subunit